MKISYLIILFIACLDNGIFGQTTSTPWTPELGRDYQTIETTKPIPQIVNSNIHNIQFYFWAGSASSYQLDLALQDLLRDQNNLNIERIPLVKRPNWRLLAKTWLVVEQLPNAIEFLNSLYKSIHIDGSSILIFDDLLPLIDQNSIDTLDFKTTFYSPTINKRLNAIQKTAELFPINSVPTIIINNRWSIDASNNLSAAQFIAIIEKLTTMPLSRAKD